MRGILRNPVVRTCLVGLIVTVILFYPGFMNFDAAFQLQQFQDGAIGDWHPPMVTWIAGSIHRVFAAPLSLLLLQAGVFWLGAALTFAAWRRWWLALLVLFVGLFPPISSMVGTILKDTLFAASLLLGVGLLMTARHTGNRAWAWAALLPFFFAMGARHNAIGALPPLLLWWAWLVFPRQRLWVRVSSAVTATLLLFLMASAINGLLTDAKAYPSQQILLHDLVAVSIDQNHVMLPDHVINSPRDPAWAPFTVADLRPMYATWSTTPLYSITTAGQTKALSYSSSEALYGELLDKWLEVIPQYPLSYLKHRAKMFAHLLGLNPGAVCIPFAYTSSPYSYSGEGLNISYTPGAAYQLLDPLFQAAGNSPLFRPIVYVLSGIALFLLAWLRKPLTQVPVMAVSASGLLYLAPYIVAGTTCAYRMSFWAVAAVLTAGGLYLGGHIGAERQK